jgi:hypothetical protein
MPNHVWMLLPNPLNPKLIETFIILIMIYLSTQSNRYFNPNSIELRADLDRVKEMTVIRTNLLTV